MIRSASAILLICLFSSLTLAQQSRVTFNKNRVQYKSFEWKFYSTDNFDIYFYDGGQQMARNSADFLEDEFERITDLIGYSPYSKTKVFLYNSVSDLQQSNIGVNEKKFDIGGQTTFIKSHVEVAHPGTIEQLKSELIFSISQLLINDMMFGGSLTDMFQNAYLLNLPDWFIDGAAHYIASGWTMEMDDFARELIKNKKDLRKVTKLSDEKARLAGHSIWNFIAERYGKSSISNILNLTRIIRNEEKSISNTIGVPFKQFLFEWQNYYTGMAAHLQGSYQKPADELKIQDKNRKGLKYNEVKISPDGAKLAYTENFNGRVSVRIRFLETGDEVNVQTTGYQVIDQKVDYELPLLSWADESTLGIIGFRQGQIMLTLYDVATDSKLPSILKTIDQVRSFDFNSNGRLAILSADANGKNDLYLLSVRRGRLRRLTNDLYDDIHPVFIPNTNIILFSSNRESDTLNLKLNQYDEINDNYNFFVFNLDTTKTVLSRITNTISKDIRPIPTGYRNFYYLSDQKGIQNIFSYDLDDSVYKQISNFAYSVKTYDIDFNRNSIAYVMRDYDTEFIYYHSNFDLNQSVFTPISKRQETIQAKYIAQRRMDRLSNQSDPIQVDLDADTEANQKVKDDEDLIDTDNYVFETEVIEEELPDTESFLSQYRRLKTDTEVMGPFPYETRFSADNVVTSWVIDPLRGFGILLETQMKDILENHRFYGGVMAATDFKSGDVFGEYTYLKTLVDYSFRYNRKVIFWNTDEGTPERYSLTKFEFGASLPFNVRSRITVNPYIASTRFEDLDPSLLSQGANPTNPTKVSNRYLGFRASYVYDNAITKDMNQIEGLRGRIDFSHWENLTNKNRSFSRISLDVRNYQKIHRELVFATRLFYGKSFGSRPQKYLLGGMDNWLFNNINDHGTGNPVGTRRNVDNSDLLFVEFITSMRGFDYATFFGTDVLLLNAELRFPIIKYFYRGPISSNFFRNLQFIAFYDAGSAWTNSSPFSSDNDLNTEIIENSPIFRAEIKNFRSPWLQSYGVGMRTVMLGFYMKFDLAWRIIDYEVHRPRLQVSLGFDF